MPDRSSGPRRYVPVPGVVDLDAVEDANFAEAVGRDDDDAPEAPAPPPAPHPLADDLDEVAAGLASEPVDPAALPDPPPLADTPAAPLRDEGARVDTTPAETGTAETEASSAPPPESPTEPEPAEPAPGDSPPAPPQEPGDTPAVAPPDTPTPPADPGDPAAALPVSPSTVVATAREATASRGRELAQLVVRYGKAHVPETPPRPVAPDTGPPRMVGRVGQLIPFLRVIPWVLAALFAVSFWWDFDGQAVVLFGRAFAVEGLLKVLTVSGLIGFGTNWLAITMLFQPRQKRAIIPQGLIPAQRERVIYRLSEAISRELINADIIKAKIQASGVIGRYRDLALGVVRGVVEDPGFRSDLKDLAQSYAQEVLGSEPVRREVARLAVEKVEEQAGSGLGGVALRLYRTFAEDDFQRRVDRALDELPGAVAPLLDRIDAALDAVPEKVEARADEIEEAATSAVLSFVEGFDVRSMISERAREFDEGQLEGLLKSTSNEQLNYIKYLGAILGVFGGFVIWQPLGALALFVTIGLALWAVDEALVRARR
ncbi:DUF445 domain-containing protein [Rubrivirga sp.]|uniref:DUF445 domain-containing protein n=1 Tax=Rubrivirga sp. TaxID=1885344 RepID=UPI003B517445